MTASHFPASSASEAAHKPDPADDTPPEDHPPQAETQPRAPEVPSSPDSYDIPDLSPEAAEFVKSVKLPPGGVKLLHGVDPRFLTIVRDVKHPLFTPSAKDKPPAHMVQLMVHDGWVGGVVDVKKEAGHFMVEDGRRRTWAAQIASDQREKAGDPRGPVLIDIRIKKDTPLEAFLVTVGLNNNRREQNALEKAQQVRAILTLAEREGAPMPLKRVASYFGGVGVDTIRNWLKSLEAVPEVQEAVRAGTISQSDMIKLVNLPPDKQVAKLNQIPKKDPQNPKKRRTGASSTAAPKRTPSKHRLTQALDEAKNPRGVVILRWVLGLERNRKKVAKALGIPADSPLVPHLVKKGKAAE